MGEISPWTFISALSSPRALPLVSRVSVRRAVPLCHTHVVVVLYACFFVCTYTSACVDITPSFSSSANNNGGTASAAEEAATQSAPIVPFPEQTDREGRKWGGGERQKRKAIYTGIERDEEKNTPRERGRREEGLLLGGERKGESYLFFLSSLFLRLPFLLPHVTAYRGGDKGGGEEGNRGAGKSGAGGKVEETVEGS